VCVCCAWQIIIACAPRHGSNRPTVVAARPTRRRVSRPGIFTYAKSFCGTPTASQEFVTFVKGIEWRLPKVVFDWSA